MEFMGLSLLSNFLVACFLSLLTFLYWINRRQDYFKNHNVPFVPSTPLLGSYKDSVMGKTAFYNQVTELYSSPEVKDKPFFGIFMFHKPGLMINDPELIKQVFVKDFGSFSNRYAAGDVHDPMGNLNLFSIKAPLWKNVRGKLSPFFSSGKLKMMYYILDKISDDMKQFVHKRLDKDGKVEVELKELASLYSTDVIASCAYGVEANSLDNPKGEFRKGGSAIFDMTLWRSFELPAFFMLPQISKFFGFQVFSQQGTKFIQETITEVMSAREKNGNKRNDLIDTLIELKKTDSENFPMDILMAQAAVFFSAGFETSSATQSFALYHIAKDKDIQDKLRAEIRDMLLKSDGKVTYDSVMSLSEMPYLNQILNETLRLYPILPVLDRECINPDGYSLEPLSSFKIPQGMPVHVPVFGIHRDEKNFPNALKFDPDRFSTENAKKIKPFTHFPFGVGPRNCIGERFGLMQVKTGIVKTLMDFRLEPNANTPKEIVLEKKAMLVQSEKGLLVDFIKDPLI